MTSPAIGARVSVTARYLFPKSNVDLEGTVIGAMNSFLLVDFGPTFAGHNGFPVSNAGFLRGSFGASNTCWFVVREYATEVLVTKAPRATKQQTDRILNHLLSGKSITQLEAFGVYRIFRLAARIHELKDKGHKIVTTMRKDETGKQYAEYSLVTARRA